MDDEMRDLEKPVDSDVARMSIPRVYQIQLVEGYRYKALELLQVDNDDAIRRNLGGNLQVRCS